MKALTEVKSRPIPFSAPMVRALLVGQKTQTRRIVKQHLEECSEPIARFPKVGHFYLCPDLLPTERTIKRVIAHCEAIGTVHHMGQREFAEQFCPYGNPGERLYVKEPLIKKVSAYQPSGGVAYAADNHFVRGGPGYIDTGWRKDGSRHVQGGPWQWKVKKLNATYCPRWASRITLEITGVRVERVQDISEADADAEGVMGGGTSAEITELHRNGTVAMGIMPPVSKQAIFRRLWEEINGPDSWAVDPWVWVITFKLVKGAA